MLNTLENDLVFIVPQETDIFRTLKRIITVICIVLDYELLDHNRLQQGKMPLLPLLYIYVEIEQAQCFNVDHVKFW